MPSSSIDVKMVSTVLVFVSLSNCRLPFTPVSWRISENPIVGEFFTTFWMSAACSVRSQMPKKIRPRTHLRPEMIADIRCVRTYHLPGRLVEVPVAVREVVDPRAHKVLREQHGHIARADARQRLLEDLEAPVLPLGRRRRREERLCTWAAEIGGVSIAETHRGRSRRQERHKPSTTIRKNSGKEPFAARVE